MVEGTVVTPGEIIEIDPTKAIKKAARTPLAWLLALIVYFFSEYFKGNYDTKLSIGGTVQTQLLKVKGGLVHSKFKKFPGESAGTRHDAARAGEG